MLFVPRECRNELIWFELNLTDSDCWVELGRVTLECCIDGRQLGLNCYNGRLLLRPLLPHKKFESHFTGRFRNKCPNRIN